MEYTAAFHRGLHRDRTQRSTFRGEEWVWIHLVSVAVPQYFSMGALPWLDHMFHISHGWGGVKTSH